MTNLLKNARGKLYTGLAFFGALILALALILTNSNLSMALLPGRASGIDYSLVLDSSNKVTSAGEHNQKTKKGNDVTFEYTNVASSTSGHVTLNNGGSLKNVMDIRSIQSVVATFSGSGTLKFKTAYGGNNWNTPTTMTSGYTYDLGNNPHFICFDTSENSVVIEKITITYSCIINSESYGYEVQDVGGVQYEKVTDGIVSLAEKYLIVCETQSKAFDGSLSTLDAANNYVSVTIENNVIQSSSEIENAVFTISGKTDGTIKSNSGYYIGQTSNSNGLKSSESDEYTHTISFDSDDNVDICSSGGAYLRFNKASNQNRFRYYKSSSYSNQQEIALYRRVEIAGGSHTEYNTPGVSVIGFDASVSKTQYYHDQTFDESTLSVWAKKTGDSVEYLSKGGENGYSYVIKNSQNQTIDSSANFGSEGIYTLIISYKSFIEKEIQLTVDYRVSLTSIEVISTNTIFNTAQKLSDYTSGITANLTYNNSTTDTGVTYENFASKGVTLTLLNPSSVSYSISSLFGTAGTWTIKVTSNTDANVYGVVEITVNAIPVTGISVTGASATVEEESQLQLTASVTPNNATVQTVTWSSNHESIATVNTNGLVTGVSEGEARITATATDGSAVYGYIDITVTAKPQQSEFDAEMTPGTNALSCTVDGNEGVKVATGKASGDMTITVGAGATRLSFYAAGWNGSSTVISLTGATFGTASFSLTADSGIAGSGTAYTLTGNESDYYHETTLSGITEETEITVSASTRFALWKAKYYTTAVEPVYPTSISLEAGSTSVAIGGTTSIEVSYTPNDTNVKNVTFSSNATSVATVSSEGIITGVAAGNARITATAEAANSGSVSAYVDITVTAIAVTGVTVSPASASIAVDATQQLTATISPSNATNKNVTWSSDATSVATVSSTGLVTAKAAGTATITVTSAADNTKKATATITVTESGGGSGQSTGSYSVMFKTGSGDGSNLATSTTESSYLSSGEDFINSISSVNKAYYGGSNGLKLGTSSASGSVTFAIDSTEVESIVVNAKLYNSSKAATLSVNSGTSQSVTSSFSDLTFDIDSTITSISFDSSKYIWISGFTVNVKNSTPTNPTSISISPASVELAPGGSKNLAVNYTPSNANQNKEVTWSRYSGSSNISVSSSGVVSVSSNATAGNTAVIRATLTNITSIYAQCTVTVVEQTQDDQTILIYLCGSDLESNGQTSASSASGYASGDITEILKVGSQPDDVNVVIETGGAKCWKTTHGINKSYLERYHVANKSLVRDSQEPKANMGLTSTLQSFLTWGVQTYPADRISLILWNHGGAMRGVCYDENYSSDCLTNSEVKTAVANTFTSLGRSTSDKFEWIGYDACLMQVQDIAEFNSQYFNYMVASEESEAGAGWDYDNWIDDAYAKKTTPNILKAICDSFLAEQGSSSDQTLSYLDLSYMSTYKSAWETMSSTINSMISSYGKSKFQTLMKTCQYYGSDNDCEGYSYFGILDAKDVVNKIRATSAFSSASTQTSAVLTAFNNLVAYSKAGTQAGNSYGLCCFFPMKDGSGYTCSTSSVYTSSQTNFTNWRSIVTSYGD